MKKVLTVLHPFDMQQQVYVYDNGNKIDEAEPILDTLNDTLFAFIDKYELTRADFRGPKRYANGIVEDFKKAEMTKYSEQKVECYIV